MFEVTEEHQMLRDLVKKFVRNELMPLEKNVLERFASGQPAALTEDESERLFKQCKELGLWALDVPEEAGGANLPAVALVGVNEELGTPPCPSPSRPTRRTFTCCWRQPVPSSARNISSLTLPVKPDRRLRSPSQEREATRPR
jgi:hypothetical protein